MKIQMTKNINGTFFDENFGNLMILVLYDLYRPLVH